MKSPYKPEKRGFIRQAFSEWVIKNCINQDMLQVRMDGKKVTLVSMRTGASYILFDRTDKAKEDDL